MDMSSEAAKYCRSHPEAERLHKGIGPLELARTQELIARYFPPAPAIVLDVGGGPGAYACWLAELGYEVHLIDAMPLHVEQAKFASSKAARPIASAQVGDARRLALGDASADAVLLHGLLYHLTERLDRLQALREADRVSKPGGVLAAVAISPHASTHVGLARGWITNPEYLQMCRQELTTGQHVRPASWPNLFSEAFFHRPETLKAEIEEAGLRHECTLAVEGAGWLLPDFEERWKIEADREALLTLLRWMERDVAAITFSAHIFAVARKEPRHEQRI